MTKTESKFRNWAKKEYPEAYIKKMPDYKQLGSGAVVGLPDYLLIDNGDTIWYEVKSAFGDTITLKHFTSGQLQEFPKMIKSGAIVRVYCFTKTKGEQIIDFEEMMRERKIKFE